MLSHTLRPSLHRNWLPRFWRRIYRASGQREGCGHPCWAGRRRKQRSNSARPLGPSPPWVQVETLTVVPRGVTSSQNVNSSGPVYLTNDASKDLQSLLKHQGK